MARFDQPTGDKFQKRPPCAPGARFGRLVAVSFVDRAENSVARWRFRCDCGNEIVRKLIIVRRGEASSCGCWKRDRIAAIGKSNATHKMTKTPEYNAWAKMISRCYTATDNSFEYYGARGISVCDRWRHSFENFISDMGRRPSAQHSLDRKENNGNYEPTNCRWATDSEQMRNRSISRIVHFQGRDMSLAEACEIAGLGPTMVWKRLNRGWSLERSLS